MKGLNKKGAFDTINKGMLAFITFILVVVLVVVLVQITKETNIVCGSGASMIGDTCYTNCGTNYTINTTSLECCNSSGGDPKPFDCASANTTALIVYDGGAYNATVDMQEAARLPAQFSQVIVIVIIIVGILGMLAFVGYGAYKRLKG